MKNSVTKKIIIRSTAIITLIMVIASIVIYIPVRNLVYSNNKNLTKRDLDIVYTSLKSYILKNDVECFDEYHFEKYCDAASELCNKYDIDYIYMYDPNIKKDTLTYYFIAGNDDTQKLVDKVRSKYANKSDKSIKANFNQDEKDVINGKKEYGDVTYNNSYGEELGIVKLLKDDNGHQAVIGVDVSFDDLKLRTFSALIICISVFIILCFLVSFSVYYTIKNRIITPARTISNVMNKFVTNEGFSAEKIEVKGNDEIGMIATAFNTMTDEIQSYVTNIQVLSKEQEKRNTEMEVANELQQGLLQNPYYATNSYEMRAMMKPAKEVGGDLYDYLRIDDDNILLVIADVSGKGISAGMFMSLTLTSIRQLAKLGKSPQEIVSTVNVALSSNNPQTMFVTAFVGVYNTKTMTLTYSNAGHNLPYVLRHNELITLDKAKGVPLGLFDDEEYDSAEIKLSIGDILYMYTDGVTEAVSEDKSFYSEKRLESQLKNYDRKYDGNIVDYIYNSIKEFSGNEEQSDDITMLSFGIRNRTELLLDANVSEFPKIKEVILASTLPKKKKLKLCLACEEWFDNICMYSYNNDDTYKKAKFMFEVSDKITLAFEDWGKKYNPLEKVITKEDYDVDNQVGGLGKLIIVNIADKVDYQYKDGKNILEIISFITEE